MCRAHHYARQVLQLAPEDTQWSVETDGERNNLARGEQLDVHIRAAPCHPGGKLRAHGACLSEGVRACERRGQPKTVTVDGRPRLFMP